MSATQAHALPSDGTVVAGQADIQTSGSHNMLITQSSDRVIINWNNFSIAGNKRVQFLQPGQSALAVNRVTGGAPSQIFGALTASGQLMLINPNGILFGQTSRVDVHSLVATTLDTADERLLSNEFRFDVVKNPSATVVNRGVITAADGGLVALVAPGVANDGLIQARLGRVALASAHEFSVDLYGDGLVSLPVNSRAVDKIYDAEGNALSAPVSNSGTIRAPGGQVLLAARTAKNMADDVVNMSGSIKAHSVDRMAA